MTACAGIISRCPNLSADQSSDKKGRYKDFSAAIQEAAWKHFGESSIFEEYGLTPGEVERSHTRTLKEIARERKSGQLKPWKR
jgi:hypothetical protein